MDLTTTTEGLGRAILGDLTPAIDGVVTKITAWEKANPDLAKEIAEVTLGIVGMGTAVGALVSAWASSPPVVGYLPSPVCPVP